MQHTACDEPSVLHSELIEPEVSPAASLLLCRAVSPAFSCGALLGKPLQEFVEVGRVKSLGFKSQWQKESEPRDVIAILAAFVQRSRRSCGTTRGSGRTHIGGQHRADHGDVGPNLAVERRDPAVRASVAVQAHVARGLLGAADIPALQLVPDVRLGGAGAEQPAQRVMSVEVLSVFFGLCWASFPTIDPTELG